MREHAGLLYLSLKTFSALGNFVNEDKDKILMRTTLFKNGLSFGGLLFVVHCVF